MKKEEFLKKHPYLEGDIIYPFQNGKGFIDLEAIHETQLDKDIVKGAIVKYFVHGYEGDGTVHSSNCRMCKVLKELGLDK